MPELLWLLVAVVLIMGLAYLVTRFIEGHMPGHPIRKNHERMLHSVEQLYLGRDRQIILVRAGDRYFLLGNTANQINTLAELSAEEVEAWREKERQTRGEVKRMSFSEALRETLKQRSGRDNSD